MSDEPVGGDPVGTTGGCESDVLLLTVRDDRGASTTVAVAAALVREVARGERITPYPGAPVDVAGVTAVRGQIVVVLDVVPRSSAGADADSTLIVLAAAQRALALSGARPSRVAATGEVQDAPRAVPPVIRLWSGRVLPLAGTVRLLDAARRDAADAAVLPLLDAAALIDDVVDDPHGDT